MHDQVLLVEFPRTKASAIALLASVAFSGCSGSSSSPPEPALFIPDAEVWLGYTIESRVASQVTTPVCLTGTGKAEIVSVTPVKAVGGVTISDFSVVSVDHMERFGSPGQEPRKLSRSPAYKGLRVVTERCPKSSSEAARSHLVVELTRPGDASAVAWGLRVTYETDKRAHTDVDIAVALCPPDAGSCPEGPPPS